MPVTVVVVDFGRMPTISTVSLTLSDAALDLPVTTVPRPVIVKTSSIGMRNGLSMSRTGLGDRLVDRVHQLQRRLALHSASPSSAFSAETRTTGRSSPGNS